MMSIKKYLLGRDKKYIFLQSDELINVDGNIELLFFLLFWIPL
jgi:hypothetical protein